MSCHLDSQGSSIEAAILAICHGNADVTQFIMGCLEDTPTYFQCVVPLTCSILGVHLYRMLHTHGIHKDTIIRQKSEWNTLTKLYVHFTRLLLSKVSDNRNIIFERLTKLAAHGTLSEPRKVVYTAADLRDYQLEDYLDCACLKNEKPFDFTGSGKTPEVTTFVHLCVQEFLTAVHIVLNWKENYLRTVLSSRGKHEVVYIFLAGLLGDETVCHPFIKSIHPDLSSDTLKGRAKQLMYRMNSHFPKAEERCKKIIQRQMFVCMAESRLYVPLSELKLDLGNKLDLSYVPHGLLPHDILAVTSYLKANPTVTKLM